MAHKFDNLQKKMGKKRIAASNRRVEATLNEMLLGEIRKLADMTQVELAEALDVSQPHVSRLEGQDDMQISTLQRIVEALGGELDIIVKMPKGRRISLGQFRDSAA